MKKRIFLGIKANIDLISEIEIWQKYYNEKIKARWISNDNLHITLVPPWYEENITAVSKKIDSLVNISPFDVTFKKVTFGPTQVRPRLIWTEGQAPLQLHKLKNKLEKVLDIAPEKRDFKLHLTLARFREKDFKSFNVKTIEDTVSWKMKINSFQLFESILRPSGAEYKILEELKLSR